MTALSALAHFDSRVRNADSPRAVESTGRAPAQTTTGGRLIAFHNACYETLAFGVSVFEGPALSLSAAVLFEGAYARLGYSLPHQQRVGVPAGVSLEAVADNKVLGTLSVTLDSPRGIQADALYADEIASFRRQGEICEFTRLAIDTAAAGREVLCSLFYVGYVYAHLVQGATDLFVEVNPRHVSFYKRMLGFRQRGELKQCARVGAPAILLHLDFRYTAMQINRSRSGLSADANPLYKHAATADQEYLLVQSMRNASAGHAQDSARRAEARVSAL